MVAHIPGKGKYAGQLGALLVELPPAPGQLAQRFKLGPASAMHSGKTHPLSVHWSPTVSEA